MNDDAQLLNTNSIARSQVTTDTLPPIFGIGGAFETPLRFVERPLSAGEWAEIAAILLSEGGVDGRRN
jgi:hypothetical protein